MSDMYFLNMHILQKSVTRTAVHSYARFHSGHENWIIDIPLIYNSSNDDYTNINTIWHKMYPLLDTIDMDIRGILGKVSNNLNFDVDELNVIVKALDFYVRLNIGQFEIMAEQSVSMTNRGEIQEFAYSIKRILGFSRYGNYGIHHQSCEDAQKAYDILCVIRHRLNIDCGGSHRVWEPSHAYKEWSLPIIEKI